MAALRGFPIVAIVAVSVFLSAAGCARRPPVPADPVARGRLVYLTNCAVCHNANPNIPGTIGPAIAGSPRTLILDRVTRASYPPGYKPKRSTRLMQPLPWITQQNIDDLTAFLASAARSSNR
jgi:mono/diheme cytochrome c family protein